MRAARANLEIASDELDALVQAAAVIGAQHYARLDPPQIFPASEQAAAINPETPLPERGNGARAVLAEMQSLLEAGSDSRPFGNLPSIPISSPML